MLIKETKVPLKCAVPHSLKKKKSNKNKMPKPQLRMMAPCPLRDVAMI